MHTLSPARLARLRWAVRSVLALGIVASVAANILAAQPHPISRTISAWPPLALLLTVELLSRIPVRRRGLAAVRIAATAAIAAIAAWISYWHMVDVALAYGEVGLSAYLLPASVDGLIVVASICLMELGGRQSTPDAPSTAGTQSTPDEPSTRDEVARPSRPVHVVAASTPARRRTAKERTDRPTADLGTVLRVMDEAGLDRSASRDAIARAVRRRYRISNDALRDMLPAIRQSVPAAA